MGSSSFAARLAVFLALVVLVATGAAATLWALEQNRRLQDAVASHAGFVLSEVKSALEARLNLGLALADLPQVLPLLDGARADMPAILSVAVLDEAGAVLFSTSPVDVGERVAELSAERGPGAVWSLHRGSERLYGIDLTTSFDTVAGAVLLRLPGDVATEPTRNFALTLAIGGLALAVPLTVLAVLAGMWVARGPRDAIVGLTEALEGLVRANVDQGHAADGLGVPLLAFAAAVRERLTLIAAAEREVTRLDEMA